MYTPTATTPMMPRKLSAPIRKNTTTDATMMPIQIGLDSRPTAGNASERCRMACTSANAPNRMAAHCATR